MVTLLQPRSAIVAAWPLREDAQAAAQARNLIREALTELFVPRDPVDDAVLMVSELVGNAVMYGDPPFELVLRSLGEEFRVEMTDSGTVRPAMRATGVESEHGRGLGIVFELSGGRCGWRNATYVTRSGPEGKAVWFIVPTSRMDPP
ncbi:ATP-binding protein [Streptosporangium sp. NPDC000509]|uniref:ATP-binding protein n=1 Tax=Streptosporangium sp. NPDC000509 TaxID=3366186 RepID=UPI0036B7A2D1